MVVEEEQEGALKRKREKEEERGKERESFFLSFFLSSRILSFFSFQFFPFPLSFSKFGERENGLAREIITGWRERKRKREGAFSR